MFAIILNSAFTTTPPMIIIIIIIIIILLNIKVHEVDFSKQKKQKRTQVHNDIWVCGVM